MENFQGFGLSKTLEDALARMGYTAPTPIQVKAIPLAMEGRDILGSAQTGTGKTAAFAIPMVEMVLNAAQGNALVLTPTRELAKQVLDVVLKMVGHKNGIKTAFLIGGESMGKQNGQLKMKPRIIVGTPGRINDHLKRGSLKLNETSFLVLDETDRMLDMGFGVQIDAILKHMPARRQTLMFSATLPDGIVRLSSKYLNKPERISMGATNVVAANIKQDVIRIDQDKKYAELVSQLHAREGSVIIFVKTKHGTEKLAKNLTRDGFESDALHGDLKQSKRTRVMGDFRRSLFRVLVATDVAARGLDVPHIEHVINYDLPQVAEDYIHRMGRTARAGAAGSALCFVSPQDGAKWRAIEMLMNPGMKQTAEKPRGRAASGERNRGKRPAPRSASSSREESRRRPSERAGGAEYRGTSSGTGRREARPDNFAKRRPTGERTPARPRRGEEPSAERPSRKEYSDRKPAGAKPPFRKNHADSDAPQRDRARPEGRSDFKRDRPAASREGKPRRDRAEGRSDFRKEDRSGGGPKPANKFNKDRKPDFRKDKPASGEAASSRRERPPAEGQRDFRSKPSSKSEASPWQKRPASKDGRPDFRKKDGDAAPRRNSSSKPGSEGRPANGPKKNHRKGFNPNSKKRPAA